MNCLLFLVVIVALIVIVCGTFDLLWEKDDE